LAGAGVTCIVGVEYDGKVIIGGDSAYTDGWTLNSGNGKVFRNGPYVIGCCGSPRMAQLLRYGLATWSNDVSNTEDLDAYMVMSFIEDVRTALKTGGWLNKENEHELASSSQFLVGIRGRLFEVNQDLQCTSHLADYNAIGVGEAAALGALYVTAEMAPRARVLAALSASEAHNAGVRGPFTILESEPA
jgi:ATP-dependent protease HslVU (ClpYQ) peptidase subunit